ncbi:methionine synthase, partial [Mycobacterium tuberculosis M1762]
LTEPKPDAPVRYRFHFPRQQRGRFLCIADFILHHPEAKYFNV